MNPAPGSGRANQRRKVTAEQLEDTVADRESEEFERALRQLGPRDQNLAAAVKTSLAGGQSRADALAALTRFRQELASAILISGPISGAGVNPARAIGPMILTGKFTDWWAYLMGASCCRHPCRCHL